MNTKDQIYSSVVGLTTIGVTKIGITLAGFKSVGITAGTLAAKYMSATAIANGGAVAAGSTVSALQSIGALGLGMYAVPVFVAGYGGYHAVKYVRSKKSDDQKTTTLVSKKQ